MIIFQLGKFEVLALVFWATDSSTKGLTLCYSVVNNLEGIFDKPSKLDPATARKLLELAGFNNSRDASSFDTPATVELVKMAGDNGTSIAAAILGTMSVSRLIRPSIQL